MRSLLYLTGRTPSPFPAEPEQGYYLDVAENARIISAGTMHEGQTRMTSTMLTVEFQPEGSGTLLIFTDQSAFYGGEKPEDRAQGWGEILDKLEATLA